MVGNAHHRAGQRVCAIGPRPDADDPCLLSIMTQMSSVAALQQGQLSRNGNYICSARSKLSPQIFGGPTQVWNSVGSRGGKKPSKMKKIFILVA